MSLKRKMNRRREATGHLLEVVHGALPQAWHSRLASEIREAIPGLHALVHDDPRAAVAELRSWIEREPLPMFYNWLSAAHSALGEMDAVDELVLENYRRNPHYLFARINYAEMRIAAGDLAGAREALGDGFDIRRLLRGKRRVHITEVTGYFYAVGRYHIEAGDLDAAHRACELLEDAAPDAPPTRALRHMLRSRLRDTHSK